MANLRGFCIERILPHELRRPEPVRTIGRAAGQPVRAVVADIRKLWPNGATLRVKFLEGSQAQRAKALGDANAWKNHANLLFVASGDADSEIRVTFDPGLGAWSYIGTDALGIARSEPTMNLGFDDGGTYGHEFGHAIGLGHEHQNPAGGIEWNEAEVIRDLSGPPNNWDQATIQHNVLKKYEVNHYLRGTAFDPSSIMLYAFPGRWTRNMPNGTSFNAVLSDKDKQFAKELYPGDSGPAEPVELQVMDAAGVEAQIGDPGEEDMFAFQVARPGRHVVETGGQTDLVMKLFGPDSKTALIAEDDDGGEGRNSRIAANLGEGRYFVQIRHFNKSQGTGNYTTSVSRG
jgi:hypothetical protein